MRTRKEGPFDKLFAVQRKVKFVSSAMQRSALVLQTASEEWDGQRCEVVSARLNLGEKTKTMSIHLSQIALEHFFSNNLVSAS